ncbi:hypothetical protein LQV05_004557 [Cryptococcus neoformans]|nr:hypothetical protein J007_04009 [Cryptococcus neoformans var. grubii]OXC60392.1 hypothetical protein C358_04106 [Cryptococcus neoformans var. grubii MW-RSA852]UOH81876.1 hypothetical protein LQV05_004557 [Cryptococcus neoformans]
MDNQPLQPLKNPKYRHISRSAAKRESVQMLGSIQNLRLQFSQVGVSHKTGAGAGVRCDGDPGVMGLGMVGEDDEENIPLPKEERRERRERKPWKEVDLPRVEPEAARKEAQEIVTSIRQIWGLSMPVSPTSPNGLSTSRSLYFSSLAAVAGGEEEARTSEDIRSALVTTARSMRRIRFLALSVSQGQSSTSAILAAPNSKLRTSFSTPSRPGVPLPRAVSSPLERRVVSGQKQEDDVLTSLRKSALDVLTALRALEERLRIQVGVPEDNRILAPINSQSSSVEPEYYESEYDSDDYNLNALAQVGDSGSLASLPWEERLVQESRSYRVLEGQEWEKEARMTREGVGKWVAVVEKLFLVCGEGEDGEKELPEWAKDWQGDAFARLHALLSSHLPTELALTLPSPQSEDFRSTFLSSLSDGYVLIQAYNAVLLQSSKPWGFIPEEDIHPTLAVTGGNNDLTLTGEEGKKDKEWTFRRVGNLTCFAAALRHRYQLPILMPSSTSASSFLPKPVALPQAGKDRVERSTSAPPSTPKSASSLPSTPASTTMKGRDVPKIEFDPMAVAKKLEGWEEMLEEVVSNWVAGVVREINAVREARKKRGGMI